MILVSFIKTLLWITVLTLGVGMIGGCVTGLQKVVVQDTSIVLKTGEIIDTARRQTVPFQEMMFDLNRAGVVYVGERHTHKGHHAIQLKILGALFKADPDMIVGMEMFDKTYQAVLDQWSHGKLTQQDFIERVHWYANWRYPYGLYQKILEFIRDNQIPLKGLNLPPHIPPKIRTGGIQNLRAEEKKFLPREIDTSNPSHRAYLKQIFEKHKFNARVKFDYFYLAQCAWDDAMAEAIARQGQGRKMLVLTGNGHIVKKFGIPNRAYRRTSIPFRTVYLAPIGSTVELSDADYIWITRN